MRVYMYMHMYLYMYVYVYAYVHVIYIYIHYHMREPLLWAEMCLDGAGRLPLLEILKFAGRPSPPHSRFLAPSYPSSHEIPGRSYPPLHEIPGPLVPPPPTRSRDGRTPPPHEIPSSSV